MVIVTIFVTSVSPFTGQAFTPCSGYVQGETIESTNGEEVLKVYIVDDSPLIRERLREMIARVENIEIVGERPDLDKSVSEIKRTKPNVLVLDIRIVGGTGFNLLLAVEQIQDMIKIVLSNYSSPGYRNACMMAGADYFFDKSKDYPQLKNLMRRLATLESQGGDDARLFKNIS